MTSDITFPMGGRPSIPKTYFGKSSSRCIAQIRSWPPFFDHVVSATNGPAEFR
jgi:hypothetical protein